MAMGLVVAMATLVFAVGHINPRKSVTLTAI